MQCGLDAKKRHLRNYERKDFSREERTALDYTRTPTSFPILVITHVWGNTLPLMIWEPQCYDILSYSDSMAVLPQNVREANTLMLRKLCGRWRETMLEDLVSLYKIDCFNVSGAIFHDESRANKDFDVVRQHGGDILLDSIPFVRLKETICLCELVLQNKAALKEDSSSPKYWFKLVRPTVQQLFYERQDYNAHRGRFSRKQSFPTGPGPCFYGELGQPLAPRETDEVMNTVRGMLYGEYKCSENEGRSSDAGRGSGLDLLSCMQRPSLPYDCVATASVELAGSRMVLVSPSGDEYMVNKEFIRALSDHCASSLMKVSYSNSCVYFSCNGGSVMMSETGIVVFRGKLESYPSCMREFCEKFISSMKSPTVLRVLMKLRRIVVRKWISGATTVKAKQIDSLRGL